jgi:hypothetical protein
MVARRRYMSLTSSALLGMVAMVEAGDKEGKVGNKKGG